MGARKYQIYFARFIAIPFVILTATQAGTDRSSTSLHIRNKIFARLTFQVIHSHFACHQTSTNLLLFANGIHFNSLPKSKVLHTSI